MKPAQVAFLNSPMCVRSHTLTSLTSSWLLLKLSNLAPCLSRTCWHSPVPLMNWFHAQTHISLVHLKPILLCHPPDQTNICLPSVSCLGSLAVMTLTLDELNETCWVRHWAVADSSSSSMSAKETLVQAVLCSSHSCAEPETTYFLSRSMLPQCLNPFPL